MRLGEEAMVVVHRPGPEFLVLLRSPEDHGYWHLVAGGIEEGEEPAAAARRELEEETALAEPRQFGAIPLELGYRHTRGGFRVRVHPFTAEAPAGWEPTLNEEHVDYRWLSERDANALLEFPEPRQAVSAVARSLETGR
jgi:8-oxo-dGTP pyrophosphatase MutT (NUDIX family)